jgi:D-xylose transport system permease protein
MASTEQAPTEGTSDFALDARQPTVGEALRDSFFKRGDLGVTPAVAGLIALFIVFGIFSSDFLTKGNIANLLQQATWVMLLGVAVTFVLLLGEIDLSAGYTAGVSVVTMAYLMAPPHNVTPWIAIPAGFVIGASIGFVIGVLVAVVGIPAFVATLAFFLGLQGVVLLIAKEGGTIAITNDLINGIVNSTMRPLYGWILWLLVVGGYLGSALWRTRSRTKAGLGGEPIGAIAIKGAVLALGWGYFTYIMNQNRAFAGAVSKVQGVPDSVPLVLVVVTSLSYLLTRTSWGRHVYAVGGNQEAARRAGINVARLKISCFVVLGLVACLAGMALGSQLNSVSPQTGGNDTLLRAVGAAAIGGVSLFGGRGRLIYPVVGGLVVATIDNGLGLIGKIGSVDFTQSGPKFIVQGIVLLLAASVDAVSRRRDVVG